MDGEQGQGTSGWLLILATCCRIQWTSCSPVADPGDTLSHLLYSDCSCSCWWHVATVVDSKFRMLINVALLAADGEDVVLASPPCWWTRHDSTTVQRTRTRVQSRRCINRKKKVQSKELKSKSSEDHKF